MRVPGVRAFALKKPDNVAQGLKIVESFATSVTIKNNQRYSPEALARNAPIRPIHDHVMDALFAPRRQPIHFCDFFQRAAAQRGRLWSGYRCAAAIELYEPLLGSAENHRLMATPAMRIAVRKFLLADKHSSLRQQRDDGRIRFEHGLALIFRQAFHEPAVVIERSIGFEAVFLSR